jgi:hypothetical protein
VPFGSTTQRDGDRLLLHHRIGAAAGDRGNRAENGGRRDGHDGDRDDELDQRHSPVPAVHAIAPAPDRCRQRC